MRQGINRATRPFQRGIGLIEVMVSIVIAMLLVLVIYQIYEVSEGQKRTITAGSDATQNAAFALYSLTRDIASAGNGIASSATDGSGKAVLDGCAMLRPIPVLIEAGATDNDWDKITVLYGGSASLSTPVQFKQNSTVNTYVVQAPVGFSANADPKKTDVVVAVQGATCTIATIDAGGVAVDATTGFATLSVTPMAGNLAAVYSAVAASLVNLGPAQALSRVEYTVDTAARALRTQKLLPTPDPAPAPLVSDVVNVKAQYGLDTDSDGVIDRWQNATGAWSSANVSAQPLATLRQIRAIRLAIVTRSAQYEKDTVTPGPLVMFDTTLGGSQVSMTLSADEQHYRYKVFETIVPLRNAVWNPS